MISPVSRYAERKATAVAAWLPSIPEHWVMRRGKWLFREMHRSPGDADETVTCFRDGTVTLRRNRRLRGFTEALKEIGYQGIRRGDLVIHAMDAFAGAIGVSDSDGKGSPVYSVCTPVLGVDAHYFAYLLREMARSQWILALSKGIRERSTDFRFADFGAQFLPLPPPSEQAAIVRYLDYHDALIRRYLRGQRRLIALLTEQKQAIIQRAVTRGLNPDASMDLGVVLSGAPFAGWSVATLKQLTGVKLQNGVFKRKDSYGSGAPLINVADIYQDDNCIHADNLERVQVSESEKRAYSVRPGDLFFVRSSLKLEGTGRCAWVRNCERGTVFECHLVRARPDQSRVVPRYLALFLNSPLARHWLISRANTVTMSTIAQGTIGAVPVAYPPIEEQHSILGQIDGACLGIDLAIVGARRQIQLATEYRTRLIADVVTGQVDVRAAAAALPEVEAIAEQDEEQDDEDEDAREDALEELEGEQE